MNAFFNKIGSMTGPSKEERETIFETKKELLISLESGERLFPSQHLKLSNLVSEGKIPFDNEIQQAFKNAYLRSLKERAGESPILLSEEVDVDKKLEGSLEKTRYVVELFKLFDYRKHATGKDRKKGYQGPFSSFIKLFENNQEFTRLTKASLIVSLKDSQYTCGGEFDISNIKLILFPAVLPEEIKNSFEVREAAQSSIANALRGHNLILAIEIQKYFELPFEVLQSVEIQVAAKQAIAKKEEFFKRVEEDPALRHSTDISDRFELQNRVDIVRGWITKRVD